jgi:hypothetical protein
MPRITEISDKFFNRDDAGMTLTEFTSKLIADETKNGEVGVKATSAQDYVVNGQDVYRFLSDRGNGRIYDGLKSLELMARIIKGVSLTSVSLFDNEIIAFTADDMKNASMDVAVIIVNSNIGVKEVYDFAKSIGSPEIESYDAFINKIARQVRAGGFKTEDHIAEALVRVKALIKSVINSKVVR